MMGLRLSSCFMSGMEWTFLYPGFMASRHRDVLNILFGD